MPSKQANLQWFQNKVCMASVQAAQTKLFQLLSS